MILKTIFLAAGLNFAALMYRGEALINTAFIEFQNNPQKAFINIVRAGTLWPVNYWVREFNAVIFNAADSLPPEVVISLIDKTLAQDPNAANLNHFKMINELRVGDLENALPALKNLEKNHPTWAVTKNARNIYDTVSKMLADRRAVISTPF